MSGALSWPRPSGTTREMTGQPVGAVLVEYRSRARRTVNAERQPPANGSANRCNGPVSRPPEFPLTMLTSSRRLASEARRSSAYCGGVTTLRDCAWRRRCNRPRCEPPRTPSAPTLSRGAAPARSPGSSVPPRLMSAARRRPLSQSVLLAWAGSACRWTAPSGRTATSQGLVLLPSRSACRRTRRCRLRS